MSEDPDAGKILEVPYGDEIAKAADYELHPVKWTIEIIKNW